MRTATTLAEHAPQNAMDDPGEIARFHDRCSDLMRELLGALAEAPDRPHTFPEIEDAMGWPRRRIASVLGGVCRLRQTEFGGRRPYRFGDARHTPSGRWELWMDAVQARAVRAERREEAPAGLSPRPLPYDLRRIARPADNSDRRHASEVCTPPASTGVTE